MPLGNRLCRRGWHNWGCDWLLIRTILGAQGSTSKQSSLRLRDVNSAGASLTRLDMLAFVAIAAACGALAWLLWGGVLAPLLAFVVGWGLVTTLVGIGRQKANRG